jgi:hypothetical protein
MGYQRVGGIEDMIKTAMSGVGIAGSILANPYVPEIICRVKQVDAHHTGRQVALCVTTPSVPDSLGIGKFMPAVRAYAYAEQHRWAYPLLAALLLGVPFMLGYAVGKNR